MTVVVEVVASLGSRSHCAIHSRPGRPQTTILAVQFSPSSYVIIMGMFGDFFKVKDSLFF